MANDEYQRHALRADETELLRQLRTVRREQRAKAGPADAGSFPQPGPAGFRA